MRNLWLDIETASPVSIADSGAYRYAMDAGFRILLVAYAWDDEPVRIVDLTAEEFPQWLIDALLDPAIRKHAHNAAFERVCFTMQLRRFGRLEGSEWLEPSEWDCSMIQAARCGLPLSLKQCGEALGLKEQKMDEGKKLIALFCLPHPDRKSLDTDEEGFVRPAAYPEQWETFKAYCIRDVEVEREIARACAWYPVSETERELYATDQRINDRGVRVDRVLVTAANRFDAIGKGRLSEEAVMLTGLDKPGSVVQLKGWIEGQLGRPLSGLTKQVVSDLMKEKLPLVVRRVLEIRAELGKTSTTKYSTMLDVMDPSDDRARGLTQFYGTRTGRWAGRLVQMQNLPQNHIGALDAARRCVREGDYEGLELAFGNVPDTLSQLIRTSFIPAEGKVFAVCDFSAIEARVLAWLAGEGWVLDAFRAGKDIYCETASQMFHVPVEKHGQNSHLRQRGKVAVLALGYQGGVGALDKMGGARLGMTEKEESETVAMWRSANERIVSFWGAVETAARNCIMTKADTEVVRPFATLTFRMEGKTLTIELPSGRRICYPDACVRLADDKWEALGVNTPIVDGEQKTYTNYAKKRVIAFHGLNQTTRKWEWVETYGGKITENITQAVARDCLAHTMSLCEKEGFKVCFHIHDELVMEAASADGLTRIEDIFKTIPAWAEGLPLRGAGYTGNYYFKD